MGEKNWNTENGKIRWFFSRASHIVVFFFQIFQFQPPNHRLPLEVQSSKLTALLAGGIASGIAMILSMVTLILMSIQVSERTMFASSLVGQVSGNDGISDSYDIIVYMVVYSESRVLKHRFKVSKSSLGNFGGGGNSFFVSSGHFCHFCDTFSKPPCTKDQASF